MRLALLGLLLLLAGPALGATGNVILIVMDDVGNDIMAAYAEEAVNAITPNIDALRAQGVLFRNAYAQPLCSPTRATIMTGRNPSEYQNYVGANFEDGNVGRGLLDASQPGLPAALAAAGYRVQAMGKWHLAWAPEFNYLTETDDGIVSRTESHPNDYGFTYFAGHVLGNLNQPGGDYTDWYKWTDGVVAAETTYATTDTSDEAQAKLGGTEPFFLYVAFNAAHAPLHEPPCALLNPNDCSGYSGGGWTNFERYQAAIEAMDTEIGNIVGHGDFNLADTTVIIMGDNGTPGAHIQGHASTHAKGSMYEGGINVPLIVAGEAVLATNTESAVLVQATDLYATILEIAGVTNHGRPDSVSFGVQLACPTCPSKRTVAFAELFEPNGGPIDSDTHDRAIRDSQYKLICLDGETDMLSCEFYDLNADPYEAAALDTGALTAPQQASFDTLVAELRAREFTPCCGADNTVRRLQ